MFHFLIVLFLAATSHAAPAEIGGQVSLGKNLTLKPGGILFIFAKKAGNPMPVAVLRVPEAKFPLPFKISEKNAMAPGTPFEGPLSVTARYSPSGDAMDKSGPQSDEVKAVAVGREDLKLELKSR